MRRRLVLLLAIVGVMIGLVVAQTGHAFMMEPRQCDRGGLFDRTSSGGPNGMSYERRSAEIENDADQSNETLCQRAENRPRAYVFNENKNINPQFTLVGNNSQTNNQSNPTWIDQSQSAKAVQANLAFQSIWVNWARPGGYVGGGGPPIENDADQSNDNLTQTAYNRPEAWVFNKNVNFNPQFTLVGNNSQSNTQSNPTTIDQSQHAGAGQVNVTGQSIQLGTPIDPENDADQDNGTLNQQAHNEPKSVVGNKNVNFNPQFTLVGNNSQTNDQSNDTSIDQSQHAGAGQGNLAGQSIQLG